MNEPERQHYIPQSYLKNFADKIKSQHYKLHAQEKGKDEIEYRTTKSVCYEKNLYTIPTKDLAKKYALETFYATNVDDIYPSVYNYLIDDNKKNLDYTTRIKILRTILSFYFRTPKFLNQTNQEFEDHFLQSLRQINSSEFIAIINKKEVKLNSNGIKQIIEKEKEKNRIAFLANHLEDTTKFIKAKMLASMAVYTIDDNSEFITCDNPVILRPQAEFSDGDIDYNKYYGQIINPFSADNMIQVPLDKKTMLCVLPQMKELSPEFLQRVTIGKRDVVVYNDEIYRYAENWILGSENGIRNYYIDRDKANELTEENIRGLRDYREIAFVLKDFVELLEEKGPASPEVKAKVQELKANPKITGDERFKHFLKWF